ncbi:MAG TPA: TadE/TadG family type IV pilus assembly protein [Bryobacteraceae bacterium]|jgi:Flp pilus assembly protein TadG|nr:TadE/TadG family type IV pilus assembly protein [Bryobacteraceae bacterium]
MDSNIKTLQQSRGQRSPRQVKSLTGIKSLRRKSAGSVIVETALIFLVFACLLLGAFDFGQFLFVHQALVERARYAARWGAINDPTDSASITNMVLYNSPSGSGTGYFNLTAANVLVTSPGAGTDNYVLNVQLSGYKYTRVSPYIAGTYTGPQINVSVPLGIFN